MTCKSPKCNHPPSFTFASVERGKGGTVWTDVKTTQVAYGYAFQNNKPVLDSTGALKVFEIPAGGYYTAAVTSDEMDEVPPELAPYLTDSTQRWMSLICWGYFAHYVFRCQDCHCFYTPLTL
jgi:hypothetical protein